jgi:O-antigen ligase
MKPFAAKYENRLFIALLFLLVWLPLPLGSNRPWAEALFEVGTALLSLLWIVGFQRRYVTVGAAFRGAHAVLWLLAIWLLYVMLQLIPLPVAARQLLSPESVSIYRLAGETGWAPLSLYPYATFLFWLKSVAYAGLFALVLLLVNNMQRLVILGYALVFSGVFQSFYGGIMTLSALEYGFFVKKTAYLGFATGTFVNRNHLAGYLEMALAVGIGLLMATSYRKERADSWRQRLRNLVNLVFSQKLPLRLMLATMVIGLVLTRSRMGNTAFFASMLVTGLIALAVFRSQAGSLRAMFRRSNTRSAVILIASLVVIDLFIVGTWFGVEKVAQRISESSVGHDSDRVEVSMNTLDLLKDYPLTGAGGGSFHLVYPRYRGGDIVAYYDHAHQDYLEIMADVGVIGIVLLGLIVLSSLRAALKALYYRRDGLMRGMAFSSAMGVIALLIHSTVDFNLQIPANAATFMVVMALGWIALHLDRHRAIDRVEGGAFNA